MTSRSLRLIAAALAVLATPSGDTPVHAQARAGGTNPPAIFSDPDRRSKLSAAFPEIDRQVAAFMERTHLPGAAWGIVIDGELAHVGVAGQRDLAVESAGHSRQHLPHRVDDQELHRNGDHEVARRWQALARRSGRTVRAGTERPHLSDVRLAPHHRPSSALARGGVP